MENNRQRKPQSAKTTLLIIAALILFTFPGLLFILVPLAVIGAIIGIPIYAAQKSKKENRSSVEEQCSYPIPEAPQYYTQQQKIQDDCPNVFCFHKDKGEHHVRRGKEVDPWDRPDIDISKYQHR